MAVYACQYYAAPCPSEAVMLRDTDLHLTIISSTRPASHHRVQTADDCAGQPRNRVFGRHSMHTRVPTRSKRTIRYFPPHVSTD
jgi:hypothetical protein